MNTGGIAHSEDRSHPVANRYTLVRQTDATGDGHVWVVAGGGDQRGTYQPLSHPEILFEFAKLGRPNPDGSDIEDAAILEFIHRWGLLGRDAVPESSPFFEFSYGSRPASQA